MRAYTKAIVAGLIAGVAFAVPVVDDGLLASEVLGIIGAALVAGAAVWRVPNVVPEAT